MLAVFFTDDIPFEAPDMDDTIPEPPPHEIAMWIPPEVAEDLIPEWQRGEGGAEILFRLRSPAQDPLEYGAIMVSPVEEPTRCDGGECGLDAHGESVLFVTPSGLRLCYVGYKAYIG